MNGEMMLDCKVEKIRGRRVLKLKGDITMQHTPDLRAHLIELLNAEGALFLNMEKVNEIDLSGLELLCSAKLTSKKSGKDLIADGVLPESLKTAIKDSGYEHSILNDFNDISQGGENE